MGGIPIFQIEEEIPRWGKGEEFLFSNRGSEVRRDELTGGTAAAAGGSGAAGETKTSTEAETTFLLLFFVEKILNFSSKMAS